MRCIAADFPCEPLKGCKEQDDFCIQPENCAALAGAIDLFAGAAFVSKDDPGQRDRFIMSIAQAVEDAIAFPVTFAAEAAVYEGASAKELSPSHAAIVIGNATLRLIDRDTKCIPRLPESVRSGIERLAGKWMRANPVTAFFEAISGPAVLRIMHWETSSRDRPCDAIAGDPLILLLSPMKAGNCLCEDLPRSLGVMFSPHQPAEIMRIIENGFQVRVPEKAQTGPVAVVRRTPDFSRVDGLLTEYSREYPAAFSSSIFSLARIDKWAFPVAFGCPILRITQMPKSATVTAFTAAGPLSKDQGVAVNEAIAIHYSVQPPGSDRGAIPSVNAPGGVVTPGPRPGVLFYRPSAIGDMPIELTWGSLKVTVPVSVTLATKPGKASP
jgi:hypothetical protein